MKVLSGIFVLAVGLVVAGVAVLKSLDFNEYRGLIAEQAKAATGRDLTIQGELNIEISLNPAIAVEGVTFANAPWGTRPEMVKLKRLSAEVELLPLLTGDIRLKRLVLVGLDLFAETDAKGRGNWELGAPKKKAAPKKTEESTSVSLPVVKWVRIEDLKLTYRDGQTGAKTQVALKNLDIRSEGLDDPMTIGVSGDFNGQAFQADGKFGSLNTLLKGGKPFQVSLKVTAPGVNLEAQGSISKPLEARGISLNLAVDGKDLGLLAKAAGVDLPKIQPFKLSATVTDPKGGYGFENLEAKMGASDINGRLSVTLGGVPRPKIVAELNSSLIDVDALLPSSPSPEAAKKGDGKRVFPGDPLPLEGLKAVDARVRLRAKRLVSGGLTFEDVDLGVILGNGRLDVKPLKAALGGGRVNGNLVLDGSRPVPALTVNLDVRKVDYGDVLKQLKIDDIAKGKVDAKINLKGNGGSVRAIMAGLNGRARVVTEGGQIESGLLNVLSADIMSALPFVDSKGDKSIRCGVADFDIRKGQAKAKALIFETGGLSMIGTGGINLANETLDLQIKPRAKKISVLKLAMVPVNVGGTLANPSAVPDLAGTITGAVSTVKDIASGGVSIIGKLIGGGSKASGGVDETDYCKLALAGQPLVPSKTSSKTSTQRSESSQTPAREEETASPTGSTMEQIDKKLDSIGKGIGGALKGLFGK
ncbi:MAG: AsmA family protein [Rhodospirillales bacterium]